MLSIQSAFNAYVDGILNGLDLLEVVLSHGFASYTVTPDLKLVVYDSDFTTVHVLSSFSTFAPRGIISKIYNYFRG